MGQAYLNPEAPEPVLSYAQIRALLTEYVIVPLGSPTVRENLNFFTKSVLLYGPSGCGKTLLARAIAHQANAMFIDLSPHIVSQEILAERNGALRIVYMAFRCAKEYNPAIIYIDDIEQIFPSGGKKKKGRTRKGKDQGAGKMKKELQNHRKLLKKEHRVIIIGTTSRPWDASMSEMRNFFDKHIYIQHPDYATRLQLWEHFIKKYNGATSQNFDMSILAHISEGFTAGSIEKTCLKVITERRKQQFDLRPLEISEFIGPLSRTYNVGKQEFTSWEQFTDELSGNKARREEQAKTESQTEQSKSTRTKTTAKSSSTKR